MSNQVLQAFDANLRGSIELIFGRSISDLTFEHASTGIQDGGLGFRRCCDTVLLCFVASRKSIRHLIGPCFEQVANTGLVGICIQNVFDEKFNNS